MRLGIGPSEYAQRIAQQLRLYNGVLFGCSSLTKSSTKFRDLGIIID